MKDKIIIITPYKFGGVKDQTDLIINNLKKIKKIYLLKTKKDINKINKIKLLHIKYILLQYSPYGLATRGLCFWVLKLIKDLKKKNIKLIVNFHELYAYSIFPWKSAFWLHLLQKYLFIRICMLADVAITPSKKYFLKIKKFNKKKKEYFPTISSIGEAKKINKKKKILVIFGKKVLRAKVYRKFGYNIVNWSNINNYKIIDIGPPLEKLIEKKYKKMGVNFYGILNNTKILNIFKNSKYGILDYDNERIDKSSVFAAYAANGVIPILMSEKKCDILKKNYHYLTRLPLKNINSKKISLNIFRWYIKHNTKIFISKIVNKYFK